LELHQIWFLATDSKGVDEIKRANAGNGTDLTGVPAIHGVEGDAPVSPYRRQLRDGTYEADERRTAKSRSSSAPP
jgi:hypothetical protein